MPRKRSKTAIALPENVHPVTARGKLYYYFQKGRGSANPGPRFRLPNDPQSPEFWAAVQHHRGGPVVLPPATVDRALDEWLMDLRTTKALSIGSIIFYDHASRWARKAWGRLDPKGVRPIHVETLIKGMADKPGAANNFLSTMRAFSKWMRKRDYIAIDLTDGLSAIKRDTGHKPWTPEQIESAKTKLTGSVRRAFLLYLYTGMRGSDVVRLGPEHIEEGGFWIETQKRKVWVFCPIFPELAEEMKAWDLSGSGPFIRQDDGRAAGKQYTRKLFSKHFAEQRDQIPELAGTTLHGLRATAVIRLRMGGLEYGQISDIVGLSVAMITRYCRFIDKKAAAKQGIQILLANEKKLKTVKRAKNAKREPKENNKLGGTR
jgi:integrase